MAFTCGLMAAGLYFAQPLTSQIGQEIGLAPQHAGLVVTLTQLGYVAGLVLLTPLGDMLESRRLVLATMGCSCLALLAAAFAPTQSTFLAASFLVGLTACVVQMLVPLAAHMAAPEARGHVIGSVTSGLLLGILLARPVSSSLADLAGWRTVFVAASVTTAVLAVVLSRRLPTLHHAGAPSYAHLLHSLGVLFARHRTLRKRALSHGAMFGTFSLFWTAVPWLLLGQGHSQRGLALFALAGAGGALIAPLAGRWADRGHARAMTIGAMLTSAVGFAATWHGGPLWLLVLCAIVVDAGVQVSHVVSQRDVLSVDPASRSRLNSVYMSVFYVGGAIASSVAGWLFHHSWQAVALAGALLPLVALVVYLAHERAEAAAALHLQQQN